MHIYIYIQLDEAFRALYDLCMHLYLNNRAVISNFDKLFNDAS